MRKAFVVFGLLLLMLSMVGCKTSSVNRPQSAESEAAVDKALASKPPALRAGYKRLYLEGDRNQVLNLMRLGLDALQMGKLDTAHGAFNRAIQGIEVVYADNRTAHEARSLWKNEGSKIFKGEPYERAMAYYYSGLLHYWKGDLQNARARFQGGVLQDQFAEEEQFQGDIALLYYLSGWCSQEIGGDPQFGKWQFDLLNKYRPGFKVPTPNENVLILFETGKSPRKLSDGVGHYQLKFFRGRNFTDKLVKFTIDDGPMMDALAIEDVYLQATTRGGRQFDYILEDKASFKRNTSLAGTALAEVGTSAILASTVLNNSTMQGVGAGLGVLSAVTMIASANTHAEADTRYWDNLPDTIHAASLVLSSGQHKMNIYYTDLEGNIIPSLNQEVMLDVPENKRKLEFFRSRKQISFN